MGHYQSPVHLFDAQGLQSRAEEEWRSKGREGVQMEEDVRGLGEHNLSPHLLGPQMCTSVFPHLCDSPRSVYSLYASPEEVWRLRQEVRGWMEGDVTWQGELSLSSHLPCPRMRRNAASHSWGAPPCGWTLYASAQSSWGLVVVLPNPPSPLFSLLHHTNPFLHNSQDLLQASLKS